MCIRDSRTVEFFPQDGVYLNGTKLVVKGINRHSFSVDGGRTTSAALSRMDALLIKEMNMNAVRSHYPPDEHFLDMCDSLGLVYMDELAGWQNGYDSKVGAKLVKEMIERDVNPVSYTHLDVYKRQLRPQDRHLSTKVR